MATAKNLVIVESPAKAKTLKKFLGSNYKIEASVGHVRDLPKSTLGIDIPNDFEPKYITIRGKGEVLAKLRKEAKKANKIYLATDPDREGEAISWHLINSLKLTGDNFYRITFNEITKTAVQKSIKEAREIDMDLVDSQQARRALDRIVGYTISPLLWKKVKKGLSAGRVQSVTLKIIRDREEEIENFLTEEYWSIDVSLGKGKEKFTAKLSSDDKGKLDFPNKEVVDKIITEFKAEKFIVEDVKNGQRKKNPLPPFTTSTLQQEASKILNFATYKTMSVAQQLYEGIDIKGEGTVGLVSYIRTDSVRISDDAYDELKNYVVSEFGQEYLAQEKIEYKSKGRAQDAHEAIRPTHADRTPLSVKASLSKEQFKLYSLIWDRFISSQMASAIYDTQNLKIKAGKYNFRASGSLLKFPGFLVVYKKNENTDDKTEEIEMPKLVKGDQLKLVETLEEQHFTQPPARYSESLLVRTMEDLGIGRPSTYAATIGTIVSRGYVTRENKIFYTTELGEIVNDIMRNNFTDIVDADFTAKMEADLDKVEDGKLNWKEILRQFYPNFEEKVVLAEEKIGKIEIKDEVTDVLCENCGRNMVIKFGRYGKFLACPGFPDCKNAKPFFEDANVPCPTCGGKVLHKKTKKGRKYFGCENFPTCEFMSWNKPIDEKCPECGSYLIEKGTKKIKIACSSQVCGYNRDKSDENEENN